MRPFNIHCPECLMTFVADDGVIKPVFIREETREIGTEIECPICGHKQTID